MCPPTRVPLQATAGAMASKDVAGIGGAAFFNDGSAVWFQFQIHLEEAQTAWPWIGDDMQKHIAPWELLAQFTLSFCIEASLPKTRGPVACHQATDNSAADAASAKGLSMTKFLHHTSHVCHDSNSFRTSRIFLDVSMCWLLEPLQAAFGYSS